MSTCPHCGKLANPIRLSLYATTASYRCVACKKKSHFDRRMMGAIGSVAILAAVLTKAFFHLDGVSLAVSTAVGTLVLMGVMYFSLKLRRTEE